MDKITLTRIDDAIQSDYNYLRAIRDETGTNEASTAISFYTRFIESIVNGLNSIYRYHHTEEFVGRFMRRKHIFSLEEKEFSRFAEDLTDEMILTGYAPAASLVREKVIPRVILLLKRWFYVLDGIEDKEFKTLRSTLFDIISYDITALFIPGNLDRTLIHIYASQFSSSANDATLLRMYADHLKLPKDFGFYLAFKLQFPENWDSTLGKEDVKKLEPLLESILDTKKPISNTTQKAMLDKTERYVQNHFKKDLSLFPVYEQAYSQIIKELKDSFETLNQRDLLIEKADTCAVILNSVESFPSQAFDAQSVSIYIREKLKRWRVIVNKDTYDKALPVIVHDIIRVFYSRELDNVILSVVTDQTKTEKSLFLIISGWSLKFSDKFISWILFQEFVPKWNNFNDLENARTIAPRVASAAAAVKHSFKSVRSLPKNRYAALTKNFTSFHTIKKIFELFYEQQEEMGNINERTDEIYKEVIKKNSDDSTEEKIKQLVTIVAKSPKRLSEEQFDEIMYLALKQDIKETNCESLGDLLADQKVREKYQKLVFIRFDAYTFNRIMATNTAGLGNLFGTKGFIILIEAYLIGSGIEHVINHGIVGGVKTLFNVGSEISNMFLNTSFVLYADASDDLVHMFDTTFDLSPASFGRGWELMNWPRTAMSVIIPIILMFLITSYNYIFYKLNRIGNREKSYQRLINSTDRWLNNKAHPTQLFKQREYSVFFDVFKLSLLVFETVYIIGLLFSLGFEPTQLALFFFLLATICLSAFQGNKLKDEVTLGQSEAISDTIRDFIFIPIIELGKFLGGQAKSINFIPWLVQTGVEPLYKFVVSILQSFISFQRERKEEIL